MRGKLLTVALVASLPALAVAQTDGKYQCTYGDLVRRVEILTEPGVSVPCEVHYYKDSEAPGEPQVLWSAQSAATYCESQAAAFVAKLEGWGWNCGGSPEPAAPAADPAPEPDPVPEPMPDPVPDAPTSTEPGAVDDTDMLAPADPPEDDTVSESERY